MRYSLASRKKAKKKEGKAFFVEVGLIDFVEFPKKVKVHESRMMAHST